MFPILLAATVQAEAFPDYFVGWGTLTLINAGLAQAKNRSGFGWWFVSLFLGPVATFLIVILDRVEPAAPIPPAVAKPEAYSEL